MPKGTKIPPALRQAWLGSYEQGKRIDVIAREEGRSTQTVKLHIDRASQDREHQQVRQALLREAYQGHQNDLMDVLQETGKRAEVSDPQGLWPYPGRRNQMLLEALRSHIPRRPLWKAWSRWEHQAQRLDSLEKEVRRLITGRVARDVKQSLPEALTEGIADSLWFAVNMESKGQISSQIEYKTDHSSEGLKLAWGAFTLTEGFVDQETALSVQKAHSQLLGELKRWDLEPLVRLRQVMREWTETRELIEDEVEMLLLRRIVPGQCQLCPGSEGVRSRTGRPKGRA